MPASSVAGQVAIPVSKAGHAPDFGRGFVAPYDNRLFDDVMHLVWFFCMEPAVFFSCHLTEYFLYQ